MGRRDGNCNNEADLLAQARRHWAKDHHTRPCCDSNAAITFKDGTGLTGTKNKNCTKTYSCADLGLPSGSTEERIRSGKCDHLKVGFCNNLNNFKDHWDGICKFCMNPNSGCSDRTVKDFCRHNSNPICRCVNTKATTDLEKKLVEYNGENLACWSNECRRGTQPRSDRFVPSGWWKSIGACRTPSLCIMNFNDVDVKQYGGVVKFHQNCGGGATTTGNVNSPTNTPDSTLPTQTISELRADTESQTSKIKDDLEALKKQIDEMSVERDATERDATERDATDASGVEIPIRVIVGVFCFFLMIIVISRRRRRRKVQP